MQEEASMQEKGPLPRYHATVDTLLRKWGRHAVINGKEPLTGDDVLKLVEVNGGTGSGLYLVGRDLHDVQIPKGTNLQGADLRKTNLQKACLEDVNLQNARLESAQLQNAKLFESNLRNADLQGANLEEAQLWRVNLQNANLWIANLGGADLFSADLRGTNLRAANLKGSNLSMIRISSDTNLEGVRWDKGHISILERRGDYQEAVALYQKLKRWYESAGILSIAGKFHYREREAARKAQWQKLGQEFNGLKLGVMTAWQRLKGKEDLAN